MLTYLLLPTVGFLLGSVIILIRRNFRETSWDEVEKNAPYECGFDAIGSARLPFSLRFFLLAVIFLIFDVEIVLLFPLVGELRVLGVIYGFVFVTTLLVGLYHEWREGSLDWVE